MSRTALQHAPQAPEKSAAATSLRIGPVHDIFEQEAEQAAEKVTTGEHRHVAWSLSRVGLGPVQRQCSCGGTCDDCKKKKEVLQRNATSSAAVGSNAPASVASTLSRPGSALDPGTRTFMESRFGHDFSSVRIHTDHDAAASAGDVNAAAYTVGNQIVFGNGFFAPTSTPGRILLAHELAHVVQQGAGRSLSSSVNPSSEQEASLAGHAVGRNADSVPIRATSGISLAAMSIAEARRSLWSHVPDGVKEYVRPAAQAAAAQMDKVIPPNTEIPKPIENVVLHPVDTAVQAVEHPVEAVKAVEATVEAAKPAIKKVAAEIPKIVKAKVKEKVHDVVLESVGQAKGVLLEGAQIVDTVAWVPYAVHEMEKKALGNSATAKVLIDATDSVTQYATLNALAEQGLSANPREPGKPAGPFGISNAVSSGIDKYVGDPLEKKLGDGKPEQGLIFTKYEQGELEGAVATQVVLAYVGVEEVQLGLKVLGAIGGVKGLYESYERNPEGWKTDPNFWAAFIGLALGILGLRASRSASKITKILMTAGSLVPVIPLVYNLFQHYKKLPDGPEKDKTLKADAGAIVKAVAAAIHAMIQHGGGGKGAGAEQEPEGGSQSAKKAPVQEEPASAKSSTPPVDEHQASAAKPQPVTDQAPEQHAAPVADQKAPAVHDSEVPAPAKKTATADGNEKPGANAKHTEPENEKSPKVIPKEKAVATEEIEVPGDKEKHQVVGSEEGFGRCSPNCPAIPIVYGKELAEHPEFAKRYKNIRALGETDIKAATKEAAKLANDIEKYKQAKALAATGSAANGNAKPSAGNPQAANDNAKPSLELDPHPAVDAKAPANNNAASPPKISIHSKSGNAWVTTEEVVKPKGSFTKVRSSAEQKEVAGGTGDDAGHRAAASQGGSAGRENLARQNRIMNRAGGTWRELEVQFDQATEQGFTVRRKVSDVYRPEDHGQTSFDQNFASDLEQNPKDYRPYRRHVEWTITDSEGNVEHGELDFANTKTPLVREKEKANAPPVPTP